MVHALLILDGMTTAASDGRPERTCLHCVLARVLRSELRDFERRGLLVTVGHLSPALLPLHAARVYRVLRRLVREAGAGGESSAVKFAVVDLPGKSHIEVLATIRCGRRARVLAVAFARQAEGSLEAGFVEGVYAG
jgi:hypothetical protein